MNWPCSSTIRTCTHMSLQHPTYNPSLPPSLLSLSHQNTLDYSSPDSNSMYILCDFISFNLFFSKIYSMWLGVLNSLVPAQPNMAWVHKEVMDSMLVPNGMVILDWLSDIFLHSCDGRPYELPANAWIYKWSTKDSQLPHISNSLE